MAEEPIIEQPEMPSGRSRRVRTWLRIAIGASGVAALLLGGLWLARKPIADRIIADALRSRGVEGHYVISRIGPRTQRLEGVVLGDPRHPDLTARWVEADFGYSFSGVSVTGLRASGVRLRATLHDGKLDLGELAKLLPKSSGGAPALPDIRVQLEDAQALVASDYGALSLSLAGQGNLKSGFGGNLSAVAPRLTLGGCTLDRFGATLKAATQSGQIILTGPLNARSLDCPHAGLALAAPKIDADFRTDMALKSIRGAFSLASAQATQGERRLSGLSGLVTLTGSSETLQGSAALAATGAALGPATSGAIKLGGNFALRPQGKDQDYSYAGTLTAENLSPNGRAPLDRLVAAAADTPVAPLAQKLAGALQAAGRANRLTLSGRISGEGNRAQLLVNGADFAAASGATLALAPGTSFALLLPAGEWTLGGAITMGGGGLPEARLTAQRGTLRSVAGELQLQDYRAGNARLGLTPVNFVLASDGTLSLRTTVSLDGPLPDGAITGLVVPVDLTLRPGGDIRLAQDCTALRWTALRLSALTLDPARLNLCGIEARALRLAQLHLTGRIGESPLMLDAGSARYALRDGRFALAGLEARIGAAESPVHLTAATLEGARDAKGNFAGTLAGGTAVIGPVPLDLTTIAGNWRFASGKLAVDGALRVADREPVARFKPLAVPDAHLTLIDNRIEAEGTLVHPGRKVDVATVNIRHDLTSGAGRADFSMDHLRFDKALQPDDLTPLSLGIVANVDGVVEGKGAIDWTRDGLTSEGTFSTDNIAFAAAFGPVTGLKTTIHFTDLLGLKTAPHQHLTVKQVSAGVDVFDGTVDYALRSKDEAVIEGGRWPFAGGVLELLPAPLNLDARLPRHLTFRLTGLDAGAFINTLALDNVSATGTFDGLFPMVFDAMGGRIEGGLLVARQIGNPPLILSSATDTLPICDSSRQAGDLAYVGPVSNAQLGTMGKLAFDALKHLRYKCLVIHLDGALDGEFITRLAINGVNQGTAEARQSLLTRPFIGLPFIFNVRIEAPFRGLLNSAASLTDPTDLIRSQLTAEQGDVKTDGSTSGLAVQPADSEKPIEGNRK